MSFNFWLEAVIDAYVDACARGEDWREPCAAAPAKVGASRRVLTLQDLKTVKGIRYSRQHISRKITNGTFPAPFKFADAMRR